MRSKTRTISFSNQVYKIGVVKYFSQLNSYTEILKVVLSALLCYVYVRKRHLTR